MVEFQENPRHDSISPHLRGDYKTTKYICVIFPVEKNKHNFFTSVTDFHILYRVIKYHSKNLVCAFQIVKFFLNGT